MSKRKASKRTENKYKKKNYGRIKVFVPKWQKNLIKSYAAKYGESVNGFITRAIAAAIEQDEKANVLERYTFGEPHENDQGAKGQAGKMPIADKNGPDSRPTLAHQNSDGRWILDDPPAET